MRLLAFASSLLVLAAACGGQGFSSGTNDGGTPPGDATSGDAACTGAPPVCPGICGAPGGPAICQGGMWSCPFISGVCITDGAIPQPDAGRGDANVVADGAVKDAASPPDASLGCGNLTCDETTQYCQISNYPNHLDGGATVTYACNMLPPACHVTPSCGCIQTTGTCQCAQTGGGFTVTCDYP